MKKVVVVVLISRMQEVLQVNVRAQHVICIAVFSIQYIFDGTHSAAAKKLKANELCCSSKMCANIPKALRSQRLSGFRFYLIQPGFEEMDSKEEEVHALNMVFFFSAQATA
jgi:hypothetical protein